jgi:hypothetical protein
MKDPTSSAVGVEYVGWRVLAAAAEESKEASLDDEDAVWVDFPLKMSQTPMVGLR